MEFPKHMISLSPKMAKILLFGRRGEYIHVYAMFFWVFIKRP